MGDVYVDDRDFWTDLPKQEPELKPIMKETDFTWERAKEGASASDGYFARLGSAEWYIKMGAATPPRGIPTPGEAVKSMYRSEHAFSEVVTGSIYTSLHNRGLLAAPQQCLILRERDSVTGKAKGSRGMPTQHNPVMGSLTEVLVGVKIKRGLDKHQNVSVKDGTGANKGNKAKKIARYLLGRYPENTGLPPVLETQKISGGGLSAPEGFDDLLEAYFLDCLIGSWDTVGGNIFTVKPEPDTPRNKLGHPRPLKLFKLDFGNGLQFFASGGKKFKTLGRTGPSAVQTRFESAHIGLKRGFWPEFGPVHEHIVDEFPGPQTGPGTMRIAITKDTSPSPQFTAMRANTLYGLITDSDILMYWRTRLGMGSVRASYKRRIDAIISHFYKSEDGAQINSKARGEFLRRVLHYRIDQIYDVLPTWLATHVKHEAAAAIALHTNYKGGSKISSGKNNKKNTLKKRKSRKYKSKLVKNKTKRK